MPLVSVVIPCYQQWHLLPQAIRSALDQTLQDLEVIVVDDGSAEPCLHQFPEFAADPRFSCIRQDHLGLPQARNSGIERSTSAYLAFLDADDWLAPEFCARLYETLARDTRLGFAYCDINPVSEPDQNQQSYSVGASRSVTSGDILPSLLVGGYFPPAAALVPRSILDQVGAFDIELGGHADWDLWLRIAAAGYPVRYVDEKLAYYRRHNRNMSRERENMNSTRRQAIEKLLRSSPDRVGGALNELIRNVEEQFTANTALQHELRRMDAELASARRNAAAYFEETQSWISSLESAKNWHEQQAATWKARFEESRR
jgi:glycosyltransferase involved in cell wall biosynthesis